MVIGDNSLASYCSVLVSLRAFCMSFNCMGLFWPAHCPGASCHCSIDCQALQLEQQLGCDRFCSSILCGWYFPQFSGVTIASPPHEKSLGDWNLRCMFRGL